MLTLHGRPHATDTTKLLWALAEFGLPCRVMDLDDRAADARPLAPWQRDVPVLADGGFSVRGGNTILRYLCATLANGTPLYPSAAQDRANIDAWLDQVQAEMAPVATEVLRIMTALPPTAAGAHTLHQTLSRWADLWREMEPVLARQRFLASGNLTIADIAIGPYLHQWFSLDIPDRPATPHLRNYYDLLMTRPAYRQHVAATPLAAPLTPEPEEASRTRPAARRDWFRYDPNADVLLSSMGIAAPNVANAMQDAEVLAAD